jgi:hypothetical protein
MVLPTDSKEQPFEQPPQPPQSLSTRSLWIKEIPEWFLAVAALIYATGFLVVFTYFGSFGIKEAGTDFFKVKYVHVGTLCLLLEAILLVPIAGIIAMRSGSSKQPMQKPDSPTAPAKHRYRGHWSSVLLMINMLLTFYVFAMFAPRAFFQEKHNALLPIFLISFLGLALIAGIGTDTLWFKVETASKQKSWPIDTGRIAPKLRWLLCIGVIGGIDYLSFKDLGPSLLQVLWGPPAKPGGILFFAFIGVIFLIWWRTHSRAKLLGDNKNGKTGIWATAVCLMIATHYLAVLSFAFDIYPYIPAERGGGSFVDTPLATLRFKPYPAASKPDGATPIPIELLACPSCNYSGELIIVEETTSQLFLANPADAGGPCEWRRGKKPKILSISRDIIQSIAYGDLSESMDEQQKCSAPTEQILKNDNSPKPH